MYENREVFPRSPLALVAAEIRFTDAARLRQQATLDEVIIALEDRFPFADPLQQMNLELTSAAGPQFQQQNGVVLRNGDRTETLTLLSSSFTYETTAYKHFEDLLAAVTVTCEALEHAKVRPAIQRIGLRYIDEVRVPDPITDVRDWVKWIDTRLVEHLSVGPEGMPATSTQGFATYDLGENKGLSFRFAALNQDPIVVPQHLVRPAHGPGPFFVLDLDGYQDFTREAATTLNAEVVSRSLAAVHAPCGATFQSSITDESRTLFRGPQQ